MYTNKLITDNSIKLFTVLTIHRDFVENPSGKNKYYVEFDFGAPFCSSAIYLLTVINLLHRLYRLR